MSNLTKPPILDETGQDILSALADIKRNLPSGGGTSNGYSPTDATEATLADDDKMPFYDTSASGKRNSTWANIKAKLKAYFDGIYSTFSGAYADLTGKPNLTVYMQKGVDYVTAGQISGQTIGTDATAEGHNVNAYGIYSHAEGDSTSAANNQAHAEGYYTSAMGVNSHAEGFGTKALGANSHAEGKYNVGITGALHEIGNGTNDQNRKNVFVVMDSGKVFASDGDADIGSYADDSDNRVLTFGNTYETIRIEKTTAEFNQLSQAEKDDPRITYYITDKPSLGYPVQDDGSATDLTDGALATGRTIENLLNKGYTKLVTQTGSMTYSSIRAIVFGNVAIVYAGIYYNYAAANTNYDLTAMYLNLSDYFSAITFAAICGRPMVLRSDSAVQQPTIGVWNSIVATNLAQVYVRTNCSSTGVYVSYTTWIIYGTRK